MIYIKLYGVILWLKNELISIDEQIKKLQEKKERDIGKYLLRSWGVYALSTKKIFELIDSKKTKATVENTNTL